MKFVATILSLFIIILLVAPVSALKSISSTKEPHTCCKSKKQPKQEEKGHCGSKSCNPFVSCCSMMGFIPVTYHLQLKQADQLSENTFNYYSINLIGFSNENWHPPKILEA